MASKSALGSLCEYLVKVLIEAKSSNVVQNLNMTKTHHPTTDLEVNNPLTGETYEVSVKAKQASTWPSVRGIRKSNQYLVFVDLDTVGEPEFYVLNLRQWNGVLRKILPTRDNGARIEDGALVWRWVADGQAKVRKGSLLYPSEIARYKDRWETLPGLSYDHGGR